MSTKKSLLTVGILMGGKSSEKEISLESGRHVYNSLDTTKYQLLPIFVDQHNRFWEIPESLLWLNTTSDIEKKLSEADPITYEELPKVIDFAFLTTHGKYGEECLPALLHLLQLPNNSCGVLGGAINMDKFFQRKLLISEKIDVPRTVGIQQRNQNFICSYLDQKMFLEEQSIKKEQLWQSLSDFTGQPLIIKPSREGCSLAITKVKKETDLFPAMEAAFKYDNLILAEEFLEGMEITTTVLGNDHPIALTPTETPRKGDYLSVEEKFLPGDARMITPPNLPSEAIKKIKFDCVKAYQTMELRVFSRIDSFWTPDHRSVILEPNSPPGMTPSTCIFHQAAEEGWQPSDFFDQVINFGLEAGVAS